MGTSIIRIIISVLIGAVAMFVVQPFIYSSRLVRFPVGRIEVWIGNYYMPGALIVFVISVLSTIIWWVVASNTNAHRADDVDRMALVWWLIGLFPLGSIGVAIGWFRGSQDALLSLMVLFVLDVLWLYWLTTAISTPGSLMKIPPLAAKIRAFIDR